jgi:hypothetical protein
MTPQRHRERKRIAATTGSKMTFKAVRLNAVTYPVEPEERAEMARAGAEFVEVEGQTPD